MSQVTLKWGGLANADVIRGGGRSMLTVADRGEGGINFAKILLTSYVNAPLLHVLIYNTSFNQFVLISFQNVTQKENNLFNLAITW